MLVVHRRITGLVILAFLTAGLFTHRSMFSAQSTLLPSWQAKVDAPVLEQAAFGEVEFLLSLSEQGDLEPVELLETKLEKGTYVYEILRRLAERTQRPIIRMLEQMGVPYRSFWVTNMIWGRGDYRVVQLLASRNDISHIYANPRIRFDEPVSMELSEGDTSPEAIEWNIQKIRAPEVWALGFRGQGVVIGGQDTGYDWEHPALKNRYRGWDGSLADHNYNWHDAIHSGDGICGADSPEPCDDNSHGTHTMGTMVGDDGGGNKIGVAPGARWIGCRNMDEGNGTPATYIECYEWFIAPYPIGGNAFTDGVPSKAPHVINNSWSCPPSEGCNPDSLLGAVNAVRAAGILTAHSAGNSGSRCSTVNTPAAIYEASFTIGATDSGDNITNFSSRGPVTVDGSNRMKPNVSAPGRDIRSSVPDGKYANFSGTSMSAPHVAGVTALVLSAQPILAGNVDELETLIEQNAIPRTTTDGCGGDSDVQVPNNTYGWGRVDALATVESLPHRFGISKLSNPPAILPGGKITFVLSVTHYHPTSLTNHVVITDVIPIGTTFISATPTYTIEGNIVRWEIPSLGANASQGMQMVVQTSATVYGTVDNLYYGVTSDEVTGWVLGQPVHTLIGYMMRFLPIYK